MAIQLDESRENTLQKYAAYNFCFTNRGDYATTSSKLIIFYASLLEVWKWSKESFQTV